VNEWVLDRIPGFNATQIHGLIIHSHMPSAIETNRQILGSLIAIPIAPFLSRRA
jgi:hypothetical protein